MTTKVKLKITESLWKRKKTTAQEKIVDNKKGIFSSIIAIIAFSIAQAATIWGMIFYLAVQPDEEQASTFCFAFALFSIINAICVILLVSHRKGKAKAESELLFAEKILAINNSGSQFAIVDVDISQRNIAATFETGETITFHDAIVCVKAPVEYAVFNLDNNAVIIP